MTKRRDWVTCPICHEPDMRCETDEDGASLIFCVNHGCPSNNAKPPTPAPAASDELVERLRREVQRLRERAALNDRAAATSDNPDAAMTFKAWAEMERGRADDIEAAAARIEAAAAERDALRALLRKTTAALVLFVTDEAPVVLEVRAALRPEAKGGRDGA